MKFSKQLTVGSRDSSPEQLPITKVNFKMTPMLSTNTHFTGLSKTLSRLSSINHVACEKDDEKALLSLTKEVQLKNDRV